MMVYEGSSGKASSFIVETKDAGKSASMGMLVEPEELKPGARCFDLNAHGTLNDQPEGALAKTWQEDFYKPRELFISNYLK
jgi:hypothetical protein